MSAESLSVATRDSWKAEPPRSMVSFSYKATFTPHEYDVIRRGIIPQSSDDKWFVFSEDDWISFHRSWTGLCVFRLQFRATAKGHTVAQALVCDDSDSYRRESDEYEAAFVDWLIRALMLNQDVEMPIPAALAEPSRGWRAVLAYWFSRLTQPIRDETPQPEHQRVPETRPEMEPADNAWEELLKARRTWFPEQENVDALLLVAGVLRAMSERPFARESDPDRASYRFTWVDASNRGSDCVCVSATFRDSAASVTSKVLRGHSWKRPGTVVHDTSRVLSPGDLAAVQALVDDVAFWSMALDDQLQGLDGSYWVLEGLRSGHHHVVVRWSPTSKTGGAFRRLCAEMLRVGHVPRDVLSSGLENILESP